MTTRNHLLPAEQHTLRWGSHDYHWHRNIEYGPLTLIPGPAPGDPRGCPAATSGSWARAGLRTCVLHRGHTTRHAHRSVLGGPVTLWGPTP